MPPEIFYLHVWRCNLYCIICCFASTTTTTATAAATATAIPSTTSKGIWALLVTLPHGVMRWRKFACHAWSGKCSALFDETRNFNPEEIVWNSFFSRLLFHQSHEYETYYVWLKGMWRFHYFEWRVERRGGGGGALVYKKWYGALLQTLKADPKINKYLLIWSELKIHGRKIILNYFCTLSSPCVLELFWQVWLCKQDFLLDFPRHTIEINLTVLLASNEIHGHTDTEYDAHNAPCT